MSSQDLRCATRGAVAFITFDRPERRNALGDTTTRQLVDALQAAGADPAVRVVVLSGRGEAFCAGGDFEDTFERGAGRSADEWSERIRQGPNACVRTLLSMDKPVVACVNGAAVGGGATIALACDLRLASDRARFRFPFSRIGLTPEFGCSHLLPRAVGTARALELLLLGDTIDAQEAFRIGLVNRVVPHDELAEATTALAERLAELPAQALGRIKGLVHRAQSTDLDTTLELEARALGEAFTSADHRAAVAEFAERRRQRAAGRS